MYVADFSYYRLGLCFFLCKSTYWLCINVFRFFWNRRVFHGEVMEGWEKGVWQSQTGSRQHGLATQPCRCLTEFTRWHFHTFHCLFKNTVWLVSFMDRKSSDNHILVVLHMVICWLVCLSVVGKVKANANSDISPSLQALALLFSVLWSVHADLRKLIMFLGFVMLSSTFLVAVNKYLTRNSWKGESLFWL